MPAVGEIDLRKAILQLRCLALRERRVEQQAARGFGIVREQRRLRALQTFVEVMRERACPCALSGDAPPIAASNRSVACRVAPTRSAASA